VARLARRRWRLLAALALAACAAVLAAPYGAAWYHWHAAVADMERYHTATARAHLDAYLAVWPRSARAHLLAARAARRAGAYDEAADHLQQSERLRQAPSEEVTLEWSLLRVAGGDLSQSVEATLLRRTEQEPAQAPLILEALTDAYAHTHRIPAAAACVERWVHLQPDNVQALFLKGDLVRQVRGVRRAVPTFRRVLELDPERDEARWWLALGLAQTGHYEDALAHLEHLRGQGHDDPELRVHVALCQKGLGRLAEARQTLDGLLAQHPGDALALRARGEVELAAGQAVQAESWLRRAARALPYDYQAQLLLYQSLREQARREEAATQKAVVDGLRDRYDRLNELTVRKMAERPRDPALACEAGTLLLSLGQDERGEGLLLTALVWDPGCRPAHAALADYYRRHGNAAKAAYHARLAQAATWGPAP
jgi:predicted Zn-dependent protease